MPPITQVDNEDATGSGGNDILYFKQQINEREGTIQTQSAQITELESRLEAQRDRIAELIPELRDEQERNAEFQVEIQGQKDYIAELESRIDAQNNDYAELKAKLTEVLDDTQPAEAITEIPAGNEFSEAAIFAPIVSETAEDGSGGARIPPREGEVNQPVALRDLLQGTASLRVNSDGEAMAPPDELPYFREFITIIDELGSDESKFLMLMISNSEACTEEQIQSAFPGRFIDPIIHDINERAYELIEDYLIEQEGGLLVVVEEFRHALEQALKLTDDQYIMSERGRQ